MGLPNDDYYEFEGEFGYGILKTGDEYDETNGIVFLDTLTIIEKEQGKGLGGRLLEDALDLSFDFGYKKMIVHARPLQDDKKQDDLIRFYERHGFKKSEDYVSFQGVYMEIDL